jgi:hypothetical protein
VATRYFKHWSGLVPLCTSCFMKMDARLMYATAKEQHEIDTLEAMWNSTLEGANR